MQRPEVAIVGAGALGAACAWQLTQAGVRDVLVLERSQPCSGTSPRGAGLVNRLLWHPEDIGLVDRSIDHFLALDEQAGPSFTYHDTGGLLIVGPEDQADADRLFRVWKAQAIDVARGGPSQLRDLPGCEHLSIGADETGYITERDGWCVTTDAVGAMLDRAERAGARVQANAPVDRVDDGGVHLADGGLVRADRTIVAAGVWTPDVLPGPWQAPIQAYRAQACVLDHAGATEGPCVHDVPNKTYWRPEGPGKILAGDGTDLSIHDPGSKPTPDDRFGSWLLERVLDRWPSFEPASLVRAWAGFEAATPDARPLVGPVPGLETVHLCAGGNGFGFMRSPALGEATAHLAVGKSPPEPVDDLRPGRFEGEGQSFEMREGFSLGG